MQDLQSKDVMEIFIFNLILQDMWSVLIRKHTTLTSRKVTQAVIIKKNYVIRMYKEELLLNNYFSTFHLLYSNRDEAQIK